jgi:hypothetical protein
VVADRADRVGQLALDAQDVHLGAVGQERAGAVTGLHRLSHACGVLAGLDADVGGGGLRDRHAGEPADRDDVGAHQAVLGQPVLVDAVQQRAAGPVGALAVPDVGQQPVGWHLGEVRDGVLLHRAQRPVGVDVDARDRRLRVLQQRAQPVALGVAGADDVAGLLEELVAEGEREQREAEVVVEVDAGAVGDLGVAEQRQAEVGGDLGDGAGVQFSACDMASTWSSCAPLGNTAHSSTKSATDVGS